MANNIDHNDNALSGREMETSSCSTVTFSREREREGGRERKREAEGGGDSTSQHLQAVKLLRIGKQKTFHGNKLTKTPNKKNNNNNNKHRLTFCFPCQTKPVRAHCLPWLQFELRTWAPFGFGFGFRFGLGSANTQKSGSLLN